MACVKGKSILIFSFSALRNLNAVQELEGQPSRNNASSATAKGLPQYKHRRVRAIDWSYLLSDVAVFTRWAPGDTA